MKTLKKTIAAILVLTIMTTCAALAASFVKFTANANTYKRNGSSAGVVIRKGSVAQVVDANDGYIAVKLNRKTSVWVKAKYVTRAKKATKASVKYTVKR